MDRHPQTQNEKCNTSSQPSQTTPITVPCAMTCHSMSALTLPITAMHAFGCRILWPVHVVLFLRRHVWHGISWHARSLPLAVLLSGVSISDRIAPVSCQAIFSGMCTARLWAVCFFFHLLLPACRCVLSAVHFLSASLSCLCCLLLLAF